MAIPNAFTMDPLLISNENTDMKHIPLFLALMFVLTLSSCLTTSSTIVAHAPAGTEILEPSDSWGYRLLGTADGAGIVRLEIEDDYYTPLLVSHSPGSNDYIPFALDYKHKIHPSGIITYLSGYAAMFIGMPLLLAGTIAVFAGDAEVGALLAGIGGGMGLIGGLVGWWGENIKDQAAYDSQYQFLLNQNTNEDIHFTDPAFCNDENVLNGLSTQSISAQGDDKDSDTDYNNSPVNAQQQKNDNGFSDFANNNHEIDLSESEVTESSTTKNDDDVYAYTESTIRITDSTVSKRHIKKGIATIEGIYVGTGNLRQGGTIIESYDSITVTIKTPTKDEALVNIIDSDGEPFFAEDTSYAIQMSDNGEYQLSLNGINAATILIDSGKNLIYQHPKVNIDGQIYTLSIKANQKTKKANNEY